MVFLISITYSYSFELYPKYLIYLSQKDLPVLQYFYFKASTDKKIVAFTFDDGPSYNGYELVKILKKYDVPATFFFIAAKVENCDLVQYDWNLISFGIHTYDHKNYDKITYSEMEDDIYKAVNIFRKNNLETVYFRPAYGIVNKNLFLLLKKFDLKGVLWSLDSYDWNGYSGAALISRVVNNVEPGDIILMHETKISPETLENLIVLLRKKGFQIVPLKTLMKYPSEIPVK